jgi:protein O-mannosyl-transferase
MWRNTVIAIVLAVAALCVYWPMRQAEFINYDDPGYYSTNERVTAGLTPANVWWALTSKEEFNWHPLTWLSYMLDHNMYQAFNATMGRQTLIAGEAGFVHMTNVFLHIANTVLLFLVFLRMTKTVWPSALVAGLFALHPAHVESVAWVAERKDVLSGLFWILTIGAYALYVERPNWQRYVLVCVSMVLGLMAKPMLVSLPFVLLLLDIWPLKRVVLGGPKWISLPDPEPAPAAVRAKSGPKGAGKPAASVPGFKIDNETDASPASFWARLRQSWSWLLVEKSPFFLMIVGSCVITFLVQMWGGAMEFGKDRISFLPRIANLPVSYVTYVLKTLVPIRLSVFYPYNLDLPIYEVVGAALVLAAITVLVIWQIRKRPYLAVGWFYFIGTLVPVIGLVQVGAQSMADRYTYLTTIGLFIMVVWGLADLVEQWRGRRLASVPVAVGAVLVALMMALTWVTCAEKLTEPLGTLGGRWLSDNVPWLVNLVPSLGQISGLSDLGLFCLAAQITMVVGVTVAWWRDRLAGLMAVGAGALICLTVLTAVQVGYWKNTKTLFFHALALEPRNAVAHCNLGESMFLKGETRDAAYHFEEALKIDWEQTGAHNNLGWALWGFSQEAVAKGDRRLALRLLQDSERHYKESLRIDPKNAAAHNNYALLLLNYAQFFNTNRRSEGVAHLKEALQLNPDYPAARSNLANNYMTSREFSAAVEQFQELLQRTPNDLNSRASYAYCLGETGQIDEALAEIDAVIQMVPRYGLAYANKGLILVKAGRLPEAIDHFRAAVRCEPTNPQYRVYLANALTQHKEFDAAISEFNDLVRENPNNLDILMSLVSALQQQGRGDLAIDRLRKTLEKYPDWRLGELRLAYLLASDAQFHNAAEAIKVATHLCEVTQRSADCLDALAAAYADAGQFDKAIELAQEALGKVTKAGRADLASLLKSRIELYKKKEPLRQ